MPYKYSFATRRRFWAPTALALAVLPACRDSLSITPSAGITDAAPADSVSTSLGPARFVTERTSVDFGVVPVGSSSPSERIVLRNAGERPGFLGLRQVDAVGNVRVQRSTCERSIEAGDTCEITLAVNPREAGPIEAELRFSLENVAPIKITATGSVSVRIELDGDGTGEVVSSVEGIRCGRVCEATFTTPTLGFLTKDDGTSLFAGFRGDCSGKRCELHLNGDKRVTATFRKPSATRLFRDAERTFRPVDALVLDDGSVVGLVWPPSMAHFGLTRIAADGRLLWQKEVIDPERSGYAEAIAVDARGRLVTFGVSYLESGSRLWARYWDLNGDAVASIELSLGPDTNIWYAKPGPQGGVLTTGPSGNRGHVTLVDANGQVAWSILLPCPDGRRCYTGSLDVDPARGALVTVAEESESGTSVSAWILSATGEVRHRYELPIERAPKTDLAALRWIPSGGFMAAGEEGFRVESSASRGFVGRFADDGSTIWLRYIGQTTNGVMPEVDVRAADANGSGEVALVGYRSVASTVGYQPFVQRYDAKGELVWERKAPTLKLLLATDFYHRVLFGRATDDVLVLGGSSSGDGATLYRFFQ